MVAKVLHNLLLQLREHVDELHDELDEQQAERKAHQNPQAKKAVDALKRGIRAGRKGDGVDA